MKGRKSLLTIGLVAALGLAGASHATGPVPARLAARALVKTMNTDAFGKVLATVKNHALYYWTPEKKSPGKIVCTGDCAKAWPVLFVPKGTTVPRKIAGLQGTFGTIRRPDGRLQLTYNRLPLYTYAHEGPGQVLCNNANGWFVVRV